MSETEPKGPAAGRYQELSVFREPYLSAAYEASKLTIPSLFPHATDASQSDRNREVLTVPNQSLGARGVNNVASKMLLTLLPPSQPLLKYAVDPTITASAVTDEAIADELSDIEPILAEREISLTQMIEAAAIRPKINEAVKLIAVSGDTLLHIPQTKKMRVFRLNRYVVKRDPFGTVIEMILKETVAYNALPEDVRAAIAEARTSDPDETEIETADLYTHVTLEPGGKTYAVHQEVEGIVVEGSEGSYPADAPEFIVVSINRVDGEDYGRGLVESSIGDLQSYDGLQKALIESAANGAELRWLVDPESDLDVKMLENSYSGDYLPGKEGDLTAVTQNRSADIRDATTVWNDLKVSLSFTFLLNSAVRRAGERVTAEEIREVARELEDSFGGIYTVLSQDMQLPMVKRYESIAISERTLAELPKVDGKTIVEPIIVTGIQAIGRSHELDKLAAFGEAVTTAAQIDPEIPRHIDSNEWLKRIATNLSISVKGLLLDPDKVAAMIEKERVDAQQQELLSRAAPQVAGAVLPPQQGEQVNGG